MSDQPGRPPREAYTVSVISALGLELQAVRQVLDREHGSLPVRSDDSNIYVFGELSEHNAVIACLPGIQGEGVAAIAANNVGRTFPNIRYRLVVGIGGGVPTAKNDIRLGDVVISMPSADRGDGFPATPPSVLRAAVYKLQHESTSASWDVAALIFLRPQEPDLLFQDDFPHPTGAPSCASCDPIKTVRRPKRLERGPSIFCGLVASGDTVVKTTRAREKLNRLLGGDVLCFEMETAEFMHEFPALVIRGISDYADSHKNDVWHSYAAATAAWCAKAVLRNVEPDGTSLPAVKAGEKHLLGEFLTDICESSMLSECYQWIIGSTEFQTWQSQRDISLLWIKAGPGKGKAMALIGLVELFSNSASNVAYFFFQNSVPSLNNAVFALRALVWKLLWLGYSLSKSIPDEYRCKKGQRKAVFESLSAFAILTTILSQMLRDYSIGDCTIIVDAVNECQADLSLLLDWLVNEAPRPKSKVKWLLSSRPNTAVTDSFRAAGFVQLLSLDDNPVQVNAAIEYFIESRVEHLAQKKALSDELRNDASLQLGRMPAGLAPLYSHSLGQIESDINFMDSGLPLGLLRAIVSALRPPSIEELLLMIESPDISPEDVTELVELCSCFIHLRDGHIYLQHQSAKEFFSSGPGQRIFLQGAGYEHELIFERLLDGMEAKLGRDVYNLGDPGIHLNQITVPDPDPLSGLGYAATYWVDHLWQSCQRNALGARATEFFSGQRRAHNFLRRHLLHWLEALSLMRQMRQAPVMLQRLQNIIKQFKTYLPANSEFIALAADAYQFVLYNMSCACGTSLQIYYSGLTFCPQTSTISSLFQHENPTWLKSPNELSEQWSPCLHMLEGHTKPVRRVVFSPDMAFVISGSDDNTMRIWDTETGVCLHILKDEAPIWLLAVSPDSAYLASSAMDQTDSVVDMAFSMDGHTPILLSWNNHVQIWDMHTITPIHSYRLHESMQGPTTLSNNGRWISSVSADGSVWAGEASTGHLDKSFRPDGDDDTIPGTNARLAHFKPGSDRVLTEHMRPNGHCLAVASYESMRLWNMHDKVVLQTFAGHTGLVVDIALSADRLMMASASMDNTVRIRNAASRLPAPKTRKSMAATMCLVISPDGRRIASGPSNGNVKLWDIATGTITHQFPHSDAVDAMAFPSNSERIAMYTADSAVQTWDCLTGADLPPALATVPFEGSWTTFSWPSLNVNERDTPQSRIHYQHPWILVDGKRLLRVPLVY
ncbi:hypothetical protein BDW74DRAFT_187045 [Aspergillus multicolor]|uniref:uncharacterized protein n=1 Tax=Aspergillus multicolor TaxID=41759 RepID=UPI003CCD7C2E